MHRTEVYIVIAVRDDGKVIVKAFDRTKHEHALICFRSFNRKNHSVDMRLERVS